MSEWVLHVDIDQFLAAVEILRRPELAGRPVVVGGDGNPNRPRQVVATASYEARAFGVRSGMPLRTAARKCPEAVFLPSDNPAYEAASARVMQTLRSLPVVVEEWGWDEAFVGADTDDPEALAREIQARVLDETGLTCAVGIGETRLQAKTATGFAKPGGIARLTGGTWLPDDGRPARHGAVGHRCADRRAARGGGHPDRHRAGAHRPQRPARRASARPSAPICDSSRSADTPRRSTASRTWRVRVVAR